MPRRARLAAALALIGAALAVAIPSPAQAAVPVRAAANGCGSADTAYVPDSLPAVFNFRTACNGHDDCYSTLGRSKRRCDAAFLRAMKRSCRRYSSRRRATYRGQRLSCVGVAYVYYRAVSRLPQAQRAYGDAQRDAATPAPAPPPAPTPVPVP